MNLMNIEKQIFICKNDGKMTTTEISSRLQVPKYEVQEQLEILKANGLYEQYRNLTDEEIAEKTDTTVPLEYKVKAEEILNKYKFRKGVVGYSCWKELIALLLYEPKYRNETLTGTIYPIVMRKCKMETDNVMVVANALRNSLLEATNGEDTISSFLEKNGIIMQRPKQEKQVVKTEEAEQKEETKEQKEIKEPMVEVPLSTLLDYYYLKGYKDRIDQEEKT